MLYKEIALITCVFILELVHSENSTYSPIQTTDSLLTTQEPEYFIPIYALQYSISMETSLELTFKLLTDSPNIFVNTEDLLSLLSSENLIIGTKLINVNFEDIIDTTNMSINDLLRSLTVYVPVKKMSNIQRILEVFNIDFTEYLEYIVENNDEKMLELIFNGNYTEEGIQNALIIMNQTEEQMIRIIKPILLGELAKISLEDIISQFDEEVKDLFFSSNLTLETITEYETFNDMLQNFIDALNNETFWATAISNNKLVTVSEAFQKVQPFEHFLIVGLRNIENTIYNQGTISLNNSFSLITVNESSESFFMIDYEPEETSTCFYLTQSNVGNISVHIFPNTVFKGNTILANISEAVTHNLGSPLICDGYLYGVLVSHNETNLKFLTFSQDNKNDEVSYSENFDHIEIGNGGEKLSTNFILVLLFLISIV